MVVFIVVFVSSAVSPPVHHRGYVPLRCGHPSVSAGGTLPSLNALAAAVDGAGNALPRITACLRPPVVVVVVVVVVA